MLEKTGQLTFQVFSVSVKRKAGRPALSAAHRRQVLSLRLSSVELFRYQRLAKSRGLVLSVWIREVLEQHVEAHEVESEG